ncbi:AraC family transcriptional regulator [Acinetobacter nematophilus]|uniref:Helix-turn-helix domain-containing protein n=1 Tax=Acinetobacter nematophilus TaxID=2994642 RepID=A0A9X3IHQ9_9GAMM|nr:AraC family transcriptional regulator [Acinetobacter nematophilus]MCX5468085.1 helix-turn-helix domain-containing protein [Acinetobacter nematophilus]
MNTRPTVNGSIAGMFRDYMAVNHLDNSLSAAYISNWNAESRVGILELGMCLKLIQEKHPESGLGIKISHYFQPIYSGLLGYLILPCQTLNDAVVQFKKFYALMWDGFSIDITEEVDSINISWSVPWLDKISNNQDVMEVVRIGYELGISCFIKMLQQLTNEHDLITPISINLPGIQPSNTLIYTTSFNCPVFFDCKDGAVRFKKASLSVPINLNNTFFVELLDRQAAAYLESINIEKNPRSNEFLLTFQKVLGKGIEVGHPTLDYVAKQMSISKSTLKNRLFAQGLNFQILLDKVRLELAKMYLEDQHLSLTEISSLLAFSEQSAFNRFFKRVTGLSPLKYRATFI